MASKATRKVPKVEDRLEEDQVEDEEIEDQVEEEEDEESVEDDDKEIPKTLKKGQMVRELLKAKKEKLKKILTAYDLVTGWAQKMIEPKATHKHSPTVTITKSLLVEKLKGEKEAIYAFCLELMKPAPKTAGSSKRKGNYSNPVYVNDTFMNWIADKKTNLNSKDVQGEFFKKVTEDEEGITVETDPYAGQPLSQTLALFKGDLVDAQGPDGKTAKINIKNLASKASINATLNYYITLKGLKGVEMERETKDKNGKVTGTETVKANNFWRADENIEKYFGTYLNDFIEKQKKEKGDKTLSLQKIPQGAIMFLLTQLIDKEKTNKNKDYLSDELLRDIVDVDIKLIHALYNREKILDIERKRTEREKVSKANKAPKTTKPKAK